MTPHARLLSVVAMLLGESSLMGCTGTPKDTKDSGPIVLDDVACLSVDLGASCPSEGDARTALIGMETCETPIREVVASGAFVSQQDVVATGSGYGTQPYSTGDTGATFTQTPWTKCCYEAAYIIHEGQGCEIGRPLKIDGRTVSAHLAHRGDWSPEALAKAVDLTGLDSAARSALAEEWTRAALLEHASIPAFARAVLDLIALGAPADLVARSASALSDEVEHAKACFALASAFSGEKRGPGALPDAPHRTATLAALAAETALEGCIGESFAVALAAAQLREATDPAVREVLARIVSDESQHAALAWDIVRWAIASGGEPVRIAVADSFAGVTLPQATAYGIPEQSLQEAFLSVMREVITPCAAECLAA